MRGLRAFAEPINQPGHVWRHGHYEFQRFTCDRVLEAEFCGVQRQTRGSALFGDRFAGERAAVNFVAAQRVSRF